MTEANSDPDKAYGVRYEKDDDGTVRPVLGETPIKNEFGHLYDERQSRRHTTLVDRLLQGNITPVTFYRELLDMTDIELAGRTGLSRRTVRRHETPAGFGRARVSDLERYAEVFDVPLAAFFCVLPPGREPDLIEVVLPPRLCRLKSGEGTS